ncbi:MAG: di-heme oxidoredictase family protein, partial [Isosphaeraceae bacterium]
QTPPPPPPPGVGVPLPGLSADLLKRFDDGKLEFTTDETPQVGLGLVFNDISCVRCHNGPTVGGGSNRVVTKIGRYKADGSFDPLVAFGGPVIQAKGLGWVNAVTQITGESIPPQANAVAKRRTTSLFGLGLVEAIPGSAIQAEATRQATFTTLSAGRVNIVTDLRTGQPTIGRFGWKAQIGNLYDFSVDAYKEEMGLIVTGFTTINPTTGAVTLNPFPIGADGRRLDQENAPNGNTSLLAFDPIPGPDESDDSIVKLLADFQAMLAPVPRGPSSPDVVAGETIFRSIGCATCHTPSWKTAADHPIPAFRNVTLAPYSDFLLHDMGSLGDGLPAGSAGPREMRTAPLWGLRFQGQYLHDGRAGNLDAAISAHAGQGAPAAASFGRLNSTQRSQLKAFLNSL